MEQHLGQEHPSPPQSADFGHESSAHGCNPSRHAARSAGITRRPIGARFSFAFIFWVLFNSVRLYAGFVPVNRQIGKALNNNVLRSDWPVPDGVGKTEPARKTVLCDLPRPERFGKV
jgi:hypothetical protein